MDARAARSAGLHGAGDRRRGLADRARSPRRAGAREHARGDARRVARARAGVRAGGRHRDGAGRGPAARAGGGRRAGRRCAGAADAVARGRTVRGAAVSRRDRRSARERLPAAVRREPDLVGRRGDGRSAPSSSPRSTTSARSASRCRLESFVFRTLAGLAFSALYLTRGFGITAWTHALYDVAVLL